MDIIPTLPLTGDITLLPDTHEMLARRVPAFDFENDLRSAKEIRDLLSYGMLHFGGIGLAANQIGLEVRAFAMLMFNRPVVLFNPLVTELSPDTHVMTEGCLTFPGLKLKIARPLACRVIYSDAEGNRRTDMLTGIEARVALHEIDHLNGVVFTSKASKLHLRMQRERLRKKSRK